MRLPFVKMHGLGNDFVVVDRPGFDRDGWSSLAPRLANRRLGVGCDQVLVLGRSTAADLRMDIYNADGSRAEMCGNGVRCAARYARDRALTPEGPVRVETLAGVVTCTFRGDLVEVDMGAPELEGRKIPVDADGPVRDHPIPLPGGPLNATCVSMGNPHAVVFVEDAESHPVDAVGPQVESHPFFPRRTNVEFVQVLAPDRLRMRVWERGAGVTLACGTGACAALVAAHWTGRAGREADVILDGGTLRVAWSPDSGRLSLTGPAAAVFEGEFYL